MPPPPDGHENNKASAKTDGQLARDYAIEIVRKLRDAGYQALWAGGCVRDYLRGVTPQDYDIATDATPDQVRALFGRWRTLSVGEQFGVVIILGRSRDPAGRNVRHQVEVATFRKDAHYEDGRRPTSVEFSSPEEDAQRRDFTINGLFFDPLQDQVIDYVDGQRDLQGKILRAIGNPVDRFDEDKLRMLRAVRFASTLDLEIDADTQAAITARPQELSVVSAERIAIELRKTLVHDNRARGAALLRETGLLWVIFPETRSETFQQHWNDTLAALRAIESPVFADCLALLFRSVHAERELATAAIESAGKRQRFANRETQLAMWLITNEPVMQEASTAYWPTLQRLLIHPDIDHLLRVVSAVHASSSSHPHPGVAFCRAKRALPDSDWNPSPLIDGNDLQKHGVVRGAIYKKILAAVRDAQLLGTCTSRQAALELADQIAADP